MPDIICIEYLGRQGVTAPVADTPLAVYVDVCHDVAKVSGNDSTDRSAAVKASSVPGLIS